MNFIKDTLEYLKQLFTWWIEVMPWERGIRVTWGKNQKILSPGIWLKLPIVHVVYIQAVRLRVIDTPIQTVTSKLGETISIRLSLGYEITDIVKLFNAVHQPDSVFSNIALGASAKYISENNSIDPDDITTAILRSFGKLDYGVVFQFVSVTNFAKVRTYRLMGDANWATSDGEHLSTKK